jgi:hypothetical protein
MTGAMIWGLHTISSFLKAAMANAATSMAKMAMDAASLRERCSIAIVLRVLR